MVFYILKNRLPEATDAKTWAQFILSSQNTVAHESVNGFAVCTSFIGIAREPGKENPLVFETLVTGNGSRTVAGQYCSWQDAEAGHRIIVQELGQQQVDNSREEE
ncbi:MAG: hypothetical protein QMD09_15455 [Desulfatibacillaceae bacterium]|nr:hypothetical protein [Desulfatibacillaceae bacterium]